MAPLKDQTLAHYLDALASTAPAPGGGSAAAYVAALGAALISMAGRYAQGRGKTKAVERRIAAAVLRSERIRRELLKCVDLDAEAYQAVVQNRKGTPGRRRRALRRAQAVPRRVAQLCYQAMETAPVLVEHGSRHLLCDIEVAGELLLAAFRSAMINVAANQTG